MFIFRLFHKSPCDHCNGGPDGIGSQDLFVALFEGEAERLGDATLAAHQAYGEKGLPPFMLDISVLIGDPALKVQ